MKRKNYTKDELKMKIIYHEKRTIYYYDLLEEMVNQKNEIGFKYKGKI